MEQLKPLLEHKFWILLALALILPIVAWWSMANEVSAQITSRKSTIDSSFKALPPNPKSLPNKTWSDGLKAMNEQRKGFLDSQSKKLWDSQQKLFRLPTSVEPFRGPFRGKFTAMNGRDLYRVAYDQELANLRKIVDPLEPSGKGLVYLPQSIFDTWRVPVGKWDALSIPGDGEIWDAQEDIWLADALLHAVKDVNEGNQSIVDASIKEIVNMRLRGGSREDLKNRAKAISSSAKAPEKAATGKPKTKKRGFDDDGGNAAVKDMMAEENGKASSAARSPGGMPGSMSFDLNEVFGGGEGQADTSAAAPEPGEGGLRIGLPEKKASAAKDASRYIDNESANQNYVTRGFFIYVIMDHRDVPEFLASLSSMPFPAEILRVHVTRYRYDGRSPSFPDEEPTTAAQPQFNSQAGRAQQLDPAAEAYSRAMRDASLANVAVAGMMTMYRPPGGTTAAIDSAQKAGAASASKAQAPAAPAGQPAPAAAPAGGAPATPAAKAPEKGSPPPAAPTKAEPANTAPQPAGAKPPETPKAAPPPAAAPAPAAGKGS